jgi:predicted amidohydrolase YtcJ
MTGSLTPGKRFDAVIWDDDLMTVSQDEMLDVRVKGTIIDGRLVWGQVAET